MAYIPYGKTDIASLAEGDIVYYKGKVKFPNSRQHHFEDLMLLIENIGDFRPSEDADEDPLEGTFIHGQVMSGSLMGAYVDNVSIEEIAATD